MMPKFNKPFPKVGRSIIPFGPNAINRAGAFSYQAAPAMALYRQVATSLWSGDGYYETQEEWFRRFQENVKRVIREDVSYPFALAAYARDKQGLALRTSPIALYVEAAANQAAKGSGLIRRYAPRILLRADEPAEAIAYFKTHHRGVIPHGLLRGIADQLRRFDAYELAKYKHTGAVSMRDVMRLARPKPSSSDETQLWGKVVAGELELPYTWEVELSTCTTEDEKRRKWDELIRSNKLGLFALTRNIRNILKYGADIETALGQITRERVKGSGILPFQWYKAYKAVKEVAGEAVAQPMQQALEWSLSDIPKLKGVTLVACDNSGSMSRAFASRGMTNAEIGNLMGAIALFCSEDAMAGTFGSTFALALTDTSRGLFYNKEQIDACGRLTGNSTNAWTVLQALSRERIYVDRLILLSDMQCYDSHSLMTRYGPMGHSLSAELDAYSRMNPRAVVYSINLASQDNTCQFAPGQPVVELAGWSESIFQFIASMEAGEDIVQKIKEEY